MPDYSNGKIYRLVCNTTGKQYVGSTANPLYKRKSEHKKGYKMWLEGRHNYVSSYEVVKGDNYEIVLVENYPCKDRNELNARERYWIETLECVNLLVPTRTASERPNYEQHKKEAVERASKWYQEHKDYRKEYMKNYVEDNKEKLEEQKLAYREANKEVIAKKSKEWREANKEVLAEKRKEYWQTNRDALLEKQKERYYTNRDERLARQRVKVTCECGSEVGKGDVARHRRTQKHKKWEEEQN
jgi:hypothetical protein